MKYHRCGRSGLLLPAISFGLWYNFGAASSAESRRDMVLRAFDLGICHFDLANNYGPPPGSAEEAFGNILRHDLKYRRDELVISTKAGYRMWDGPYGDGGSRKYLLASLDQSLSRMGIDYVDIFYHHRPDAETPLEESMAALAQAVRQGKALYVGISSYGTEETRRAAALLRDMGTPCLIHQPRLNMLQRQPIEQGIVAAAAEEGMGVICFSPLAQGALTGRYLNGVPEASRAVYGQWFDHRMIGGEGIERLGRLNGLAQARGQTLAQLAISWVLSQQGVTSCIVGASKVSQIEDCAGAGDAPPLTDGERAEIDRILGLA